MTPLERFISLIAPHYCLGCDCPGTLLCRQCYERKLPKAISKCYRCGSSTDEFRTCRPCRASSALFRVWSVATYQDLAKDIVYKLKFERGRSAASIIAEQMAAILPTGTDWIVTSVPTANKRIRQRGYDQAQLIAKSLSRRLDSSYSTLLARHGSSRQLGQTREARKAQMLEAFRPIGERASGKHILLVDDVLTTGATLEAAAATLRKAGAKRVSAAVFAVA